MSSRHEPEQQVSSRVRMCCPSTSASAIRTSLRVAQLGDVELVVHAGAERGDEGLDLVVLQDLVDPRLLDVEDLAADREDRLRLRVARSPRRAAGAVALDDEDLALLGLTRRAVDQLAGKAGATEAAPCVRGPARAPCARRSAPSSRLRLAHDVLALGRVLLEPLAEPVVDDASGRRTWPRCCRAWSWSAPRTAARPA